MKIVSSLVFLFLLFSCKKESISWNLPRGNPFEISNFKQLCQKDRCETLDSLRNKTSSLTWTLGDGFTGKGVKVSGMYPLISAQFELLKKIPGYSIITFYTSFTSPTPNAEFTTNVYWNDRKVKTTIEAEYSSQNWKKIRLDTVIGIGNHKFRFDFYSSGTNNTLIFDELEVLCR